MILTSPLIPHTSLRRWSFRKSWQEMIASRSVWTRQIVCFMWMLFNNTAPAIHQQGQFSLRSLLKKNLRCLFNAGIVVNSPIRPKSFSIPDRISVAKFRRIITTDETFTVIESGQLTIKQFIELFRIISVNRLCD